MQRGRKVGNQRQKKKKRERRKNVQGRNEVRKEERTYGRGREEGIKTFKKKMEL